MKTLSVKEARSNLAYILERVDTAQETFVITKFGRPKAIISPAPSALEKNKDEVLKESAGIWKSRKDIPKRKNSRHGKIFD